MLFSNPYSYGLFALAFAVTLGIYFGIGINHVEQGLDKVPDLIIGILSARENFVLRDAVRKTWLSKDLVKDLDLNSGQRTVDSAVVKTWFIIGQRYCNIPPSYRINKYGCEKWSINMSDVQESFFTLNVASDTNFSPGKLKTFHQGFSFQVNHPVVVKSLGIHSKLLPEIYNISVALLDSRTKEVVVQTFISSNQPGILKNGFQYRPVENFVLPKDYEGTVLIEGYLLHSSYEEVKWNDNGGVLYFNRIYQSPNDFESMKFRYDIFAAPSIGFTVLEVNSLADIASKESSAYKEWNKFQVSVKEKLKEEMNTNEDVLLVDTLDVYRNIPQKLLHFYLWLSRSELFTYLLKTDDDCILDVSSILRELKNNAQFSSSAMWLWSRFRHHWPVNYVGKWTDFEYKSPVYPSFPCGAGYVLPKAVVHWLAQNMPYLHIYQGEDVSIGIWMAAINATYIEDSRWRCDYNCSAHSFNRAQLTADDLHNSWSKHTECGDFCSCSATER